MNSPENNNNLTKEITQEEMNEVHRQLDEQEILLADARHQEEVDLFELWMEDHFKHVAYYNDTKY